MTIRFAAAASIPTAIVAFLASASVLGAEEPAPEPQPLDLRKRVQVVDTDGNPVAGARIEPYGMQSNLAGGPWSLKGMGQSEPVVVESGEDGFAEISFPRYANHVDRTPVDGLICRVIHPEYAELVEAVARVQGAQRDAISAFVMRPGAAIEVHLDVPPGLPMLFPGEVHVHWSSDYSMTSGRPSEVSPNVYRLPRLPAGQELLRAVVIPRNGFPVLFSDVTRLSSKDGDQVQISMSVLPGARVIGKLDDAVPRPVRNGRVTVAVAESVNAPLAQERVQLIWYDAAPIAEDGSFRFDSLPFVELQLIAICDGHMAASGDPPLSLGDQIPEGIRNRPQVFLLEKPANEITVKTSPTADCLIELTDQNGDPVPDAGCGFSPNVRWWHGHSQIYCDPIIRTVDLLRNPRQRMYDYWTQSRYAVTTAADGRALMKGVTPGSEVFYVKHPNLVAPIRAGKSDRLVAVELVARKTAKVTVTLQPQGKDFIGERPGR